MLLCAGVLQPITLGKETKRDQSPSPAQHNELGTGTEMFVVPAQGNQNGSFTADVGQEHREYALPHLPAPSTPPQPHLVFLVIEFPVEQ